MLRVGEGMTEERPVQAKECYEHHMLLKGQLDRINHFLFGDPEHPEDLTITAKVNLMFNVLLEIKRWAIGAVFCKLFVLVSARLEKFIQVFPAGCA